MMAPLFKFKEFEVRQDKAAMKVNTDSILLGSWVGVNNVAQVLDIGAGTGLLSLMIAQRTVDAVIHGVEVDSEAFVEAKNNFAQAKWHERLTVFHCAIQEFDADGVRYDLVISNPPFYTGGTLSENQKRSSVRHTIKLPNNELLQSVRRVLSKSGRFAVVLPYIEGLRFIEMAKTFGFCLHRKTEVLSRHNKGVERLLIEFGLSECDAIEVNQITVYQGEKSASYTTEFIALTKDFYLKH